MAVAAANGVTQDQASPAPSAGSASTRAAGALDVDYNTFLKLLIAQMKNQDPTNPMDATEQVAQLATFSQVEQSIQTNRNLERLISSSALSEAGSIIGRTLTSADGSLSGKVEEVRVNAGGLTATLDTGDEVDVAPGVTIR